MNDFNLGHGQILPEFLLPTFGGSVGALVIVESALYQAVKNTVLRYTVF